MEAPHPADQRNEQPQTGAARLVAIAGPASGINVAVDREISVGRDAANLLCINDRTLSRHHCLLRPSSDGAIEVHDLGSANGTFVNGDPIERRVLRHRDRLSAGGSTFLVLIDGDASHEPAAEFDDVDLLGGKTMLVREGDALQGSPHVAAGHAPEAVRLQRDMAAVVRVARIAASVSESDALQRSTLDILLEALPADRAAIVSVDSITSELRAAVVKERRAGATRPVTLSRSIVWDAIRARAAMLVSGHERPRRFAESDSLISSGARSVICAPMQLPDRTIGAIYLDSPNPNAFDDGHLQLATTAASIMSGALAYAYQVEWLEQQKTLLEADLDAEHNMVGDSARLLAVHRFVKKVAPADSTVLLMGESGTGKELVARAIHQRGARASGPFIAINCAVLSETLLESELFGHERGAFTGALVQKKGKLELAERGTLFLDEIGELGLAVQAKLLRVLQEREFERVGGTRPLKADVRVIAATNRNLHEASKAGGFRSDLYYRLNVLTVVLPPLRERVEDIPLLAGHFAAKFARKCKRRVAGLAPDALACMMHYSWPGNIRQLENAIERAVVVGTTDLIRLEDLPEDIVEDQAVAPAPAAMRSYHDGVREAKKELIVQAVRTAGGKYTEAARLLGVHPNYLHMLIRTLDLKETLKR